jgi:hypothetical protein
LSALVQEAETHRYDHVGLSLEDGYNPFDGQFPVWFRKAREETTENWLTHELDKFGIKYHLTPAGDLRANDLWAFVRYVTEQPDYRSFFVLWAIRRQDRNVYNAIPPSIRASILCSALQHVDTGNNFGDPCSFDAPAAVDLLATGEAALPYLERILDDHEPLQVTGSEDAAISEAWEYRRCDYAYRYVCLILGLKPKWHNEPEQRDKEIELIKQKLAQATGRRQVDNNAIARWDAHIHAGGEAMKLKRFGFLRHA